MNNMIEAHEGSLGETRHNPSPVTPEMLAVEWPDEESPGLGDAGNDRWTG
jgi:hypothetical protein